MRNIEYVDTFKNYYITNSFQYNLPSFKGYTIRISFSWIFYRHRQKNYNW